MFYLLLIIPHVLAIGALLYFGYRTSLGDANDGFDDGWGEYGEPPYDAPPPGPAAGGPPLPDAAPPRRRVRVGETLSELYPAPSRREIEPEPERTPSPVGDR